MITTSTARLNKHLLKHDTNELRELGFSLCAQRSDKAYSLTDCISMVVMKQMDISTALTHDKHFTQEGFMIVFQDQDKIS